MVELSYYGNPVNNISSNPPPKVVDQVWVEELIKKATDLYKRAIEKKEVF